MPLNRERKMATVAPTIFTTDYSDFTERGGRNLIHLLGEWVAFSEPFKSDFDTIPHDKLMACGRMRVSASSVQDLIRGWLRAPVIETDESTGKPKPPRNSNGQDGVISPLRAKGYLHGFDKMFHRKEGPSHWANTWLVRYAADFVVMARYQGQPIDEWLDAKFESWLGLTSNPAKKKEIPPTQRNEPLPIP